MEELNKSIKARQQLLEFTNAQTSDAVEKQNHASVERLRKVEEVHKELRLEAGHDEKEILTWNADLEARLHVFENAIDSLDVAIKEFKSAAHGAAKEEEEEEAALIREKRLEKEMRYEKAKFEQKLNLETKI